MGELLPELVLSTGARPGGAGLSRWDPKALALGAQPQLPHSSHCQGEAPSVLLMVTPGWAGAGQGDPAPAVLSPRNPPRSHGSALKEGL